MRVNRKQWLACIAASDLSKPKRNVAGLLAGYMNKRGQGAYPGVRLVGSVLGVSPSYAARVLRELTAEGWLAAQDRKPRKQRGRPSKEYAATVPARYSAPLTAGRKSRDFVNSMKDTNSSPDARGDFVNPQEFTKCPPDFVNQKGDFVNSLRFTDLSPTEIEARSVEARQSNASAVAAEKAADYAIEGQGSPGRSGPHRGGRGRLQ